MFIHGIDKQQYLILKAILAILNLTFRHQIPAAIYRERLLIQLFS